MIFDKHFDLIVIISLSGAEERRNRCLEQMRDYGLSDQVVWFPAVNGRNIDRPDWWPNGKGAWGCYLSHLDVLKAALEQGVKSLLVVEDDCVWKPGAAAGFESFMDKVPDDWDQIYLGGQHRISPLPIPEKGGVYRAISVFRTHAYAVKGEALPAIISHLEDTRWFKSAKILERKHHVDHHFEKAHRGRLWNTYLPGEWIAGQGANHSSISGKTTDTDSWWQIPSLLFPPIESSMKTETPFIIFGTPRSRSTALMRILDASPGVACAGERRDMLWNLKKLHGERDGLFNNSPKAFDPISKQIEEEHFPSHYNRSTADSWNGGITTALKGWVNPDPDDVAWGLKDVHTSKMGAQYGIDMWSWLQNTIPNLKLIFLVRDPQEVAASMDRTLKWWIPSFGKCMTECSFRVANQQQAFTEYNALNPSSTLLLPSEDILDFEKLKAALAPLGIPVDAGAHEEQIKIKI